MENKNSKPLAIYIYIYIDWDLYCTMQPLTGFGVAKVLDSRHPNFKKGDLI